MRQSVLCAIAVLGASSACSGKNRPFADSYSGSGGMAGSASFSGDIPAASQAPSGLGDLGDEASAVVQPGQEGLPGVGEVRPIEAVSGAASASCGGDASSCTSVDDAGSACVPSGFRDCTSELDNDCDGEPDSVLDNVCVCGPGSVVPCDEHPGLDGRGQCRAGSRTCVASEDNRTSDWSACEGAVGPGAQDSCAVSGDDTDCDGTENGGCPCIDGEARDCGPDTENGLCQRGTQTCLNGQFGQCEGAVFPSPRNCGAAQDNDCDGRPDNTIDNVCECIPGQGNGLCSDDSNNSRCNAQGRCIPCQTSADCSVVSGGRNTCENGQCVAARFPDGVACRVNTECSSNSCVTFYGDDDLDGFAPTEAVVTAITLCASPGFSSGALTRLRPTSRSVTDCLDTNGDVYPGQTESFDDPALGAALPFDYNCDGVEVSTRTTQSNKLVDCNDSFIPNCEDRGGWLPESEGGFGIPACGVNGVFDSCVLNERGTCVSGPGGDAPRTPCL